VRQFVKSSSHQSPKVSREIGRKSGKLLTLSVWQSRQLDEVVPAGRSANPPASVPTMVAVKGFSRRDVS